MRETEEELHQTQRWLHAATAHVPGYPRRKVSTGYTSHKGGHSGDIFAHVLYHKSDYKYEMDIMY